MKRKRIIRKRTNFPLLLVGPSNLLYLFIIFIVFCDDGALNKKGLAITDSINVNNAMQVDWR